MSSVFDLFNELQRDGFSGEVEVTSSQGHAIIRLKPVEKIQLGVPKPS